VGPYRAVQVTERSLIGAADRGEAIRRSLAAFALVGLLVGCGFGTCAPSFEPLAVEQSAPLLAAVDGGLAIECRGLDPERCRGAGAGLPLPGDIEEDEVDRLVVSCVGRCDARGGETRMDVVLANGDARLIANGGYGEFEQSCGG
jgi:hypothetical protein